MEYFLYDNHDVQFYFWVCLVRHAIYVLHVEFEFALLSFALAYAYMMSAWRWWRFCSVFA